MSLIEVNQQITCGLLSLAVFLLESVRKPPYLESKYSIWELWNVEICGIMQITHAEDKLVFPVESMRLGKNRPEFRKTW